MNTSIFTTYASSKKIVLENLHALSSNLYYTNSSELNHILL